MPGNITAVKVVEELVKSLSCENEIFRRLFRCDVYSSDKTEAHFILFIQDLDAEQFDPFSESTRDSEIANGPLYSLFV